MVRIVAILKPYRLKDALSQLQDRQWVQHIQIQEEHQKEVEESQKWRDKNHCVCPQGFQSPAEL